MRFLTVSIIIFLLSLGFFVYTQLQGRYEMNNIPEPVASAEKVVSTKPYEPPEPHSHSHTAQDEMDSVLEEMGITEEVESLNTEDYTELFESLDEEGRFPEEELAETDKPKKPLKERFMDMYLPKGFTRAEIERYTEFTEKHLRREPLSLEEHTEFLELLVRFQPYEDNFRAYEKWKKLKAHIVPESWSQKWTDN